MTWNTQSFNNTWLQATTRAPFTIKYVYVININKHPYLVESKSSIGNGRTMRVLLLIECTLFSGFRSMCPVMNNEACCISKNCSKGREK